MTTRMATLLTLLLVGNVPGQEPENAGPPPKVAAADPQSGPAPELSLADQHIPSEWVWVRGDYLLGWLSGSRLPALVTTSPTGTAQTNAGVLGGANTITLFGDEKVNDTARSGFRLSLGSWLGREQCF